MSGGMSGLLSINILLLLLVCQDVIDGYNRFNLILASSVVNCQSTTEAVSFLRFSQAATSSVIAVFTLVRYSSNNE